MIFIFPSRIWNGGEFSLLKGPASFTIRVFAVRVGSQPGNVFLPPDGFTAYPNEEAMMNELTARLSGRLRFVCPDRAVAKPARRCRMTFRADASARWPTAVSFMSG